MLHFTAQCYKLGFGIVFRMAAWGMLLGAACGSLVGLVAGLIGVMVGAATGGVSGLVLGLAIGCTLILFSIKGMPTDITGYLRIARAISAYWIIVSGIGIGLFLRIRPEDVPTFIVGITIWGSIAFGAAWWTCGKVVTWVEQEL